ncbi:MAG: HAMP domain-containing histidine kinase [Bacteroidetes bacterium]|nr:HAMP domain-containing histidine kinase [Bacteroidota bacterium]
MKGKYVKILVVVGICLVALITVQVIWMVDAWNLKNKEFDKQVADELKNLSVDFEEYLFCNEVFTNVELQAGEGINLTRNSWSIDSSGNKTWNNKALAVPFLNEGENDTIFSYNGLKLNYPANIQIVAKITADFDSATVFSEPYIGTDKLLNAKQFKESIASTLKPSVYLAGNFVDTFLTDRLIKAGLQLAFNYEVCDHTACVIHTSKNWANGSMAKIYEIDLLTDNYFFEPFNLKVHFPDRTSYLLRGSVVFLIISIAIIIALLVSFMVFVKFLLRQVELSQMKTNFVNNMTHEFKTPTANISLAIENIVGMNGDVSPRLKKYVRIIGEENKRMITNVEKILEVAKYSDGGQAKLVTTQVDVNEVLYEVCRNFGQRMEKVNGKFKKHFGAENHIIECDRHHFKNILSNVLDNALKYCDKEIPEVSIETDDEDDHLSIVISDNGPGIEPADMKRIYDPFFRKDTGNVHNVKGFGLGLSYVKRAIEMHNGSIETSSKLGKGATFKILLPVHQKVKANVRKV